MENLERILFDDIIKWMERREILAIKDSRQSGKPTLLELHKK
jgi:hypothetical protein